MVRVPDITSEVDLRSGRRLATILSGRRVLLHFMTGGCVNCLHVLEELRRLELPDDLVLVSVHTGKFDREKSDDFVRAFIERAGIGHPVVNDAEGDLWDRFAVRAWPTLVLVSPDGYEMARAGGEGQAARILGAAAKEAPRSVSDSSFRKVAAWEGGIFLSRGDRVLACDGEGKILTCYEGFAEPQGIVWAMGRLFVADRLAGEVVALDTRSGRRERVAAGLRSPWGLASDGRAVQIAEAGAHRIAEWVPGRGVRTLAGLGHEGVREGDALGEALFAQPTDLDWLGGALYVADAEGSALRKIEEGRVETPVGWDLFTFGDRDGAGEEARLQHPEGLCAGVGGCGNHRIFVADTYNDKIKVFDPLTARTTTLVEGLRMPTGVSKSGCFLYIADDDAEALARFDISQLTLERIPIR